MKHFIKPLLIAAFLCSVMLSPSAVMASDHLDAPNLSDGGISGSGQQDINDLYAFRPSDTSPNTALILTVNPFASSTATFATDTAYRFEIDNTGNAQSNITYEARFGAAAGPGQTQSFSLTRNGVNFLNSAVATTGANPLAANGGFGTTNGGTAIASTFDDPFFFDFVGFQNTLNGTPPGFTGEDTFAGANVSAIVLELPSTDFGAEDIGVWATTVQDGIGQVDRVGRPAINTVLIPSDRKQEFNEATPVGDLSDFGDDVTASINGLGGNGDGLAPVLLPDILTFNTTSAIGFENPDGSANLNGRRLEDDVIDVELALLTNGNIATDGADANDVPFNSVFPFLAPAQVAAVPEPSGALAIALAFGTCLVRRRRKS